jgi:L-histidine Nalpha-methyltransferase
MTDMSLAAAERSLAGTGADPAFRTDVLEGLAKPQRSVPARWFYDHRGSELFELITELPEYYPTRTEQALLSNYVSDVVRHTGIGRAVVEFGSGSSTKTPILLAGMDPSVYVPIDISGEFLRGSCRRLAHTFPALPIHPIEADFTKQIDLPAVVAGLPKLGFFPGSTIGNLDPRDAVDILRGMAATLDEGMLLIGIDRRKDPSILMPAYFDSRGATAAFNLNLLHRINRELKGSIPIGAFRHQARWNAHASRIEMHLLATRDVRFEIEGLDFDMIAGETIHTENSYKYAPEEARLLLRSGGWEPVDEWSDERDLFAVYLARQSAFGN